MLSYAMLVLIVHALNQKPFHSVTTVRDGRATDMEYDEARGHPHNHSHSHPLSS